MFIKLNTIEDKTIEINSNMIAEIKGVHNRLCSKHHTTITLNNDKIYYCEDTEYNIKKMLIEEQYDYKKNLEHLRERYLNKISWLEKHINSDNQDNNMGLIDGLLTAIHDIEDMLNGLDV